MLGVAQKVFKKHLTVKHKPAWTKMGSCGLCKCPKTDVDSIKTQIVEIEGKSNDHWTVLAVGVYLHAN